jgi:LuxR family transcriptional regulator, maltose regulon positive regulatory protein
VTAPSPSRAAADPRPDLRIAEEALQRADWPAAHAGFRAALAVADSPEGREGLALASYWLGEADGAIAQQEAAYRLYQSRDDRRAAARVATWLALEHEAGRGQPAVASGWLQRARRLLSGLEPSAELAWLGFWEAHILLLYRGDTHAARERLAEALRLAQQVGLREVELMALGLEGVMLVHEGNLDEGMRRLDEVSTAAVSGELRDRCATGQACCYVLTTCEEVGDFERAAQWLARVRDHNDPLRLVPYDTYCRNHSVAILLWTGRWAEAEEEIARMDREARALAPGFVREATCRLGELRRRQGRTEEAEALFAQVDTHPRAILGRAWIALERGDARAAAELAERYLRQLRERDRLGRLPALELLVAAHAAHGDVGAAAAARDEMAELAEQLDTAAPRAMTRLATGTIASAAGDHDQARCCFEDAVSAFAQLGLPYEAARARRALAQSLAALRRPAEAAQEMQRATAELQALGVKLGSEAEEPASRSSTLTPREREIIRLVARGLSNKEIARELGLSEHTVHRHVGNILTRLDLPSRAAAVAYAAQSGLL